jgi:hypothetical protein
MTKREEELTAAGWTRQFVACEPRLSEMAEMYRDIGFEVLLEPLPVKGDVNVEICKASHCTACFDADQEKYKIIFTRKS